MGYQPLLEAAIMTSGVPSKVAAPSYAWQALYAEVGKRRAATTLRAFQVAQQVDAVFESFVVWHRKGRQLLPRHAVP